MKNKYDLIISIVNFNGEKFIAQCIDSVIKASLNSSGKLLIVCTDNNSSDKSREIIEHYDQIEKIYSKENIGYAAAHNKILREYSAEYFLLLNPDTVINDEFNLVKMMDYMDSHPDIVIATCSLYNEYNEMLIGIAHKPTLINGFGEQLKVNRVLRESIIVRKIGEKLGKIFPGILNNFNPSAQALLKPTTVKYIYGVYLFIRKKTLDKIGYFDEHFFLFWEEIDLCIRIRQAGSAIGYNPDTSIIHKYQQSQKSVPELSYYWHVASYFRIFKKYYHFRLIIWSIGSMLFQLFFILYTLGLSRGKWLKVHIYLFQLSILFGLNYNQLMNKMKNL